MTDRKPSLALHIALAGFDTAAIRAIKYSSFRKEVATQTSDGRIHRRFIAQPKSRAEVNADVIHRLESSLKLATERKAWSQVEKLARALDALARGNDRQASEIFAHQDDF